MKNERGELEDWIIPDDQAVAVNTVDGVIIITGCGHSGIINTIEYVKKNIPNQKILAVIGGLHLHEASDDVIAWTSEKLLHHHIPYMIATHCTGIDVVYKWREELRLDRDHLTVGAVGTAFDSRKGILFTEGKIER